MITPKRFYPFPAIVKELEEEFGPHAGSVLVLMAACFTHSVGLGLSVRVVGESSFHSKVGEFIAGLRGEPYFYHLSFTSETAFYQMWQSCKSSTVIYDGENIPHFLLEIFARLVSGTPIHRLSLDCFQRPVLQKFSRRLVLILLRADNQAHPVLRDCMLTVRLSENRAARAFESASKLEYMLPGAEKKLARSVRRREKLRRVLEKHYLRPAVDFVGLEKIVLRIKDVLDAVRVGHIFSLAGVFQSWLLPPRSSTDSLPRVSPAVLDFTIRLLDLVGVPNREPLTRAQMVLLDQLQRFAIEKANKPQAPTSGQEARDQYEAPQGSFTLYDIREKYYRQFDASTLQSRFYDLERQLMIERSTKVARRQCWSLTERGKKFGTAGLVDLFGPLRGDAAPGPSKKYSFRGLVHELLVASNSGQVRASLAAGAPDFRSPPGVEPITEEVNSGEVSPPPPPAATNPTGSQQAV